MLFPISDDDREILKPMYVTYILLAINIAVFFYQIANPEFTYGWSVIPREITTGEDLVGVTIVESQDGSAMEIPQATGPPLIWLTLLTSMFMHGSIAHIAGNMLYLWIFGDNVENRFGHLPFLAFYLAAGLVGSAAQLALDTDSVIPNLGASGAIAGIMGAYLVLYPRNRVNAVFFYTVITVPAVLVLGMWILMQLVSGYGSIAATEASTGGVAYLAHVGGFFAGVVAALLWRKQITQEPDSVLRRQYERDPRAHHLWK
jgi:membrane associated rhomboid family serine protease